MPVEQFKQRAQLCIANADPIEVNAYKNTVEDSCVCGLQGHQRFVKLIADILIGPLIELSPTGISGNKEIVSIEAGHFSPLFSLLQRATVLELRLHNVAVVSIEDIRAAFEKEQAKDIFFILIRIHLAPQYIGCLEQMTFELRQR